MIDALTTQTMILAAPWPTCHDCGEQHPPEQPCYPNGAHAYAAPGGYLIEPGRTRPTHGLA